MCKKLKQKNKDFESIKNLNGNKTENLSTKRKKRKGKENVELKKKNKTENIYFFLLSVF